ncbi:MAG: glycosyl hydrolase 115 family protein [Lachnospiraceae bacterium]|nr:glycosyl hydrolase 115 family protein [Lachnospiraceae bacterium]
MKQFLLNKDVVFIYDKEDYKGIITVLDWVTEDLKKVFDCSEIKKVAIDEYKGEAVERAIIVGSADKSCIIEKLSTEGKTDTGVLNDEKGNARWEVYNRELVDNPIPGIKEAVVISGSDKRGTMYGILGVSEAAGVSPLVNWSDVYPSQKEEVCLGDDFFITSKEPSVKYRGIFINDEWPAFGNWATKRFGGVNAKCYAEVFEMILRLHGNYMWPAMWASNFSMDGPGIESAILADELGIVMSTSHHEPCMRTGEEYSLLRGPESPYGDAWDFISNREGIIRFWEDGLKRNHSFENVITMGMRGERDTAIMAEATLEENINLLKDIIRTQNDLIRKYVNEDLTKVPRQIVLFTEVEKFYYGDENTPGLIDDPEMDGITVVFSDNNYGYTRTLPPEKMRNHKGGYGMYYHVDMHGGAYSYEWIGSTYLPRIWDQLSTTYDYGVRDIWVVNVGDIVSQELEISYIMKIANDFDTFGTGNPNNSDEFIKNWVKAQFGGYFNEDDLNKIDEIIHRYQIINERCKHEVMNESVYHPVHFNEARDLYNNCKATLSLCDELLSKCPEKIKTAFYELIYYPAYGTANLSRTWMVSMWNKFYVNQNRNTANDFNIEIDEGIKADEKLIEDFHALADGKFYGQALSEHFGFRFWNDSNNQLPTRVYVYPANKKRMLVSKSDEAWHFDGREYTKRDENIYDFLRPDKNEIIFEISCGSKIELDYEATVDVDWLSVFIEDEAENACEYMSDKSVTKTGSDKVSSKTKATQILHLVIDRSKMDDEDVKTGKLVISDKDDCFVTLTIFGCTKACCINEIASAEGNCKGINADNLQGVFLETDGYVAMEAGHYSNITKTEDAYYELLAPYGRTGTGIKMYPNTKDYLVAKDGIPYVEYIFVAKEDAEYDAEFVFAPSLPVNDSNSQCFGYDINDNGVISIDTILNNSTPIFWSGQWAWDNRKNAKITPCKVKVKKGINHIKYYQINPNLILERIVLWNPKAAKKESYLGPVESFRF